MRSWKADTWMWARAQEMLEDAARIQRQFCTLVQTTRVPSWSPPIDLFERGDDLLILVVLPGVALADIELHLQEGLLCVRAPRQLPVRLRDARILHMEIPLGLFERSIPLPDGRFELRDSEFAEGVLHLYLKRNRGDRS